MSLHTGIRPHKRADREPCGIAGCAQKLYASGVCVMHYNRLRKSGDVGSPERKRREIGSGSINGYGYRVVADSSHPLAGAQGKLLEHRGVLFDAIGPGPHPCHWCGKSLDWRGSAATRINVDHLDNCKTNNERANLVVACLNCNSKRSAK